ncbi:ORF1343 [White spot syndrome virus]|uniref:ORF1343 n=1 Tax=White spot syndrome virus TaxID=342409 RepID=A0A2D3I7A5_9VIRU|nr:ORF1343 [White spot syndrome virus]
MCICHSSLWPKEHPNTCRFLQRPSCTLSPNQSGDLLASLESCSNFVCRDVRYYFYRGRF